MPTPGFWRALTPASRSRLQRLGIQAPADLLFHLPLRYEDRTRLTPVAELVDGQPAQVEGELIDHEVTRGARRQLRARLRDAGGHELMLRWLNFYPSQQRQLAERGVVRAFGEVRLGLWGAEMVHPQLSPGGAEVALDSALRPIYPTTAGLAQRQLQRWAAQVLDALLPDEPLATDALENLDMMPLPDALRCLHQPPASVRTADDGRLTPAWRRLKFQELVAQQLFLRRARLLRGMACAPELRGGGSLLNAFLAQLPFPLTDAQARVWREISGDLATTTPMQRLLLGDVGSGKTIVAALAMLTAADAGRLAVMMAPTEILAEQHHAKLSQWLTPLGIEVACLLGRQGRRARAATCAALADGRQRLVVGTHALLEDPVVLPRLGVVVVDEQHRFGVRQRLALREKTMSDADASAMMQPHLLMMSATPIPRTLAMTHYADLDVSVIDQLPPGRTPVRTRLLDARRRQTAIDLVRDVIAGGGQVYWVCPLIEHSEALQLRTAEETHAELSAALQDIAQVGLLHGRLKRDDKSATMAAFVAGELAVLVATTVIEVGVDVPNASLMVIEHAERFGLAQLHQLRGRVGRGRVRSSCVLLFESPLSALARERLKVIYEQSDGFAVAQEDLRIRGPGEFVGARQSGAPLLRFADLLADADLIDAARTQAAHLLAEAPGVADRWMQGWVRDGERLLRA